MAFFIKNSHFLSSIFTLNCWKYCDDVARPGFMPGYEDEAKPVAVIEAPCSPRFEATAYHSPVGAEDEAEKKQPAEGLTSNVVPDGDVLVNPRTNCVEVAVIANELFETVCILAIASNEAGVVEDKSHAVVPALAMNNPDPVFATVLVRLTIGCPFNAEAKRFPPVSIWKLHCWQRLWSESVTAFALERKSHPE